MLNGVARPGPIADAQLACFSSKAQWCDGGGQATKETCERRTTSTGLSLLTVTEREHQQAGGAEVGEKHNMMLKTKTRREEKMESEREKTTSIIIPQ